MQPSAHPAAWRSVSASCDFEFQVAFAVSEGGHLGAPEAVRAAANASVVVRDAVRGAARRGARRRPREAPRGGFARGAAAGKDANSGADAADKGEREGVRVRRGRADGESRTDSGVLRRLSGAVLGAEGIQAPAHLHELHHAQNGALTGLLEA